MNDTPANGVPTSEQPRPERLPPPADLATVAARIAAASELGDTARAIARRPDNALGLLLRPLTAQEIAVMEAAGCRADDWRQVQVAEDFDCFRVRRTTFRGRCCIGRCAGDLEVLPGIRLPSGISDSTLIDCQIGNGCVIEGVRFAAKAVIEREAVLLDVGSLTGSGQATYGCAQAPSLGIETGGREVPFWAAMTVDDAALIARCRADGAGQSAVREAHAAYLAAIRSPVTWVRRGARILHTERVHDAWIGAAAVIHHALEVVDTAVLSSSEEPTRIAGGATVQRALLQHGVVVDGGSIVRESAILEHASVVDHACVIGSLIGPNTHVAKGEITASLVGPFVGFHHQSLLIAAFWPEGKGNIAYGAMVGSNHTGRAPDQEIWPGEGTFWGLGCAIRQPADFSEAPYTVIQMGCSTLPQKVRFPFSLISVPAEPLAEEDDHVPRAYNEIVPAWVLCANAYGLARAEMKFAARDRSRRHRIEYLVLRPDTMRLVRAARDRLRAVSGDRRVWLESEIEGLGKNFLREENRRKAIRIYEQAMLRYALRILLAEREGRISIPGSAELAHAFADELLPGTSFPERMRRLLEIERANAELVEDSKRRDDERGARIIPGYADAHVSAADDPVVKEAWARLRRTEERVARVLA
ncbi:MAG: DUF4954 family protein [Planctomycetota bacterium]|nr:DUF4954 family protein [Planctomycetota bacterium]